MKQLRNSRYLLPLTLLVLGLLLLARVLFASAFVLVPEDVDVIVLVVLLSVTMIVAIHAIVRISMNHLRLRSIQQVRRETLAEHRRFLSRLDHELKNPVTALRAGLKTLVLTSLNNQQQQLVETMETETLRLSRLVSDLRKLAELETEPLNLQPVALAPFVAAILQIERERFEAGQRLLTSHIATAQQHWTLDEDLLALAVHNLLDNAYKYSRPGDQVHFDVFELEGQDALVLRVTDTGIGIPPDALPHIWEELYRGQQTEKIVGSGTGLALVKAIVERHDGTVSIESQVDPNRIPLSIPLSTPLFTPPSRHPSNHQAAHGTSVTLRLPALS